MLSRKSHTAILLLVALVFMVSADEFVALVMADHPVSQHVPDSAMAYELIEEQHNEQETCGMPRPAYRIFSDDMHATPDRWFARSLVHDLTSPPPERGSLLL